MSNHKTQQLPVNAPGDLFVGTEVDKTGESPAVGIGVLPAGLVDGHVLTTDLSAPERVKWSAPSGGSGDTVLDLDPASPTTDLIIATGFGAGMAWLGAGTSAQRPAMYEKDGRINVEGEMKIAGGATTEQLNDLSSGSVKLIEFPRNYTAPKDIDHAIMVQVAGEAHPMLVYTYNDGAGLSVWCDGPSAAPAWFAPNAYITFEFSFPGSIDPPS